MEVESAAKGTPLSKSMSFTFLPRDVHSAKRGIAIVSRLSVCLSVGPSVHLSIALRLPWTYRLG